MSRMKWWGWGDEGVSFTHQDKPALGPFLQRHLAIDVERAGSRPVAFEQLSIPEPSLPPDLRGALEQAVGSEQRMTVDSTHVERELEQLDVALFASDEPMATSATTILTRRVKQGVAEWYVRDLIEKSRRGMEESVRQGWHTGGRIPYGYALEEHPHPNPHKAREGKKKHRLVIDPLRAPIVLMVFEDYCLRGLGLGEICDKLNHDLDRYPPPQRNRKDETPLPQTWSRSQVQAMLRNPKYTGYNVWGRHDKRRGRPFQCPRDQWVWSPTPTHEAIVPKELFDMVEQRARTHEIQAKRIPAKRHQCRGRRNGRFYPLRGRVRCAICGRRMEGSFKKGSHWYRCRFDQNRGRAAADAVGHPRTLTVKEELIIDALLDFMGRRLFGPQRLRLLRAELSTAAASSWREHDADLERLKHERENLGRSLHRQTLRLEEHDDPEHPVVAAAKRRIEELSRRRAAIDEELRRFETKKPAGARPAEIEAMLDAVPDLRPALASATPEELAAARNLRRDGHLRQAQQAPRTRGHGYPELVPNEEKTPPPQDGRWGNSDIAGARFVPPSDAPIVQHYRLAA